MTQGIIFDIEARDKLKKGVDSLANAVKVTLGAKGRNVLIDNGYASPTITKDGVTVARSIELEDAIENMGARLLKEIAQKTNENAGDGTTTATVLAQAIFNVGLKNITAGANPMDLKRGIDKAILRVVEELKSISKPVGDFNNIKNIATISANGDEAIGLSISEAIKLVSKDGVITIAESSGIETSVEVTEGMQYNKGYMSPYFVTDTLKMETNFDSPLILLCNKRISLISDLMVSLELSIKEQRPLVIIADEIDSEALKTLIINSVKQVVRVVAVKAPNYGIMRKEMMQDIAVLTGGIVIDDNLGLKLEDVTIDQFGQADKVIVTENSCTIIGGKGSKTDIENRVNIIRHQISNAPSEYDAERIRERLAKLVGGVAIINVGGGSEVEMKERKDRFDDAINATRAAIAEGIVPGGGVALLHCRDVLDNLVCKNDDEMLGVKIIKRAIEEPFRMIMSNAGLPIDVILNKIVNDNSIDIGYNVYSEQYENFFITGVLDPTKVTRVALENAGSVSGLLLTTECVIFNKEKEKKDE